MEEDSLFKTPHHEPLAERLRPKTLDEFQGQQHLLGKGKVLRNLIERDAPSPPISWEAAFSGARPAWERQPLQRSSPIRQKPVSSLFRL